jgi:DNA-binding HxlR family transcriptional regulator
MTSAASVVAKNIPTNRLRSLVAGGILRTAPAEDGIRHQEYLLTQKGHGLFHVIVGVRQWGEEHFYDKGETRSKLIDRKNKEPVRKLELRANEQLPNEPRGSP